MTAEVVAVVKMYKDVKTASSSSSSGSFCTVFGRYTPWHRLARGCGRSQDEVKTKSTHFGEVRVRVRSG